ncbi:helix-turn-helix domain-containing protein [Microbacterium sp. W4I20]|uniref:helix-turn-helix domain-containing protein n=1 Tax=Microbacterium sp. W4I20 TaxID=3042262 RepID=UPI0027892F0E|nr:helix-turn-helix domain-containing protein [Microbacterium sp. W4I20]MDQ0727864.1 transcriptional regulator with XRE-family HTH domain/tetratricopeptide (TPR) repeat protein [Microbacterium sp. W4I20]
MSQHPFGTLLRRRRQHADLTIERLSERSGVSPRTIGDIERGKSIGPQRRTVIALADGLELTGQERAEFLGAARPGRRGATGDHTSAAIRPLRLPDFSGREEQMRVIAAMLSPADTATSTPILITGTGGVGKTTVALEALHRATGDSTDVLFVNVHSPDTLPLSPLQVLQALLRQTATREEPDTMDDAVAAWRRASASGTLAVLLDNVTVEEQVRPVLTASHPVRVVLTSRRSLAGLEGSRRVVLGPLARPDGIAFLTRMIPEPQRTRGDLDELAQLCSDLPLALRIAGNRITSRPAWTVEDYTARLRAEATRLRHLVAGDLRVASTFALSFDALTPRSQLVFRSIPLITGSSFRADMVASMHPLEDETTAEILDELTDLALLEPLSGERYRIHDLLRIFAEEQLVAAQSADDIDAQRARLRRWTLDTTRTMALFTEEMDAAAGAGDVTLASARDWLTTESDSWLEALKVAAASPTDPQEPVLAAAGALIRFAERWLSFPHWRTVAQIAVTAAERLGDGVALAEQLQMMAALELALFDGDPDLAQEIAVRARAVAETAGAPEAASWALISVAWSETLRGETAAARESAGLALAEAIAHASPEAQVQSRYWIAMTLMEDDPESALAQAVEMRRTLDEHESDLPLREWNTANGVTTAIAAKALLALGRYAEAVDVADRIMDDASFFPHESDFLARAYRHRGFAHLGLGEHEKARLDLRQALDLVEEHERPDWWAAEILEALVPLEQP